MFQDKYCSLRYGDEQIQFTLKRKDLKASKVVILVQPDASVIVTAPKSAGMGEIDAALIKRAKWISNKVAEFKSQEKHTLERTYSSGESHFYLGRRYLLKVNIDDSQNEFVKLYRGQIHVNVKSCSSEKVKNLLLAWYKIKALEVFNKLLEELLKKTPWATLKPEIKIKRMLTQWGSCSPKGEILLNPHLIKASKTSIEYVLLHELCHLAEHNHSERFYRLLEQVLPNWREVKDHLDEKATHYLNV